MTRSDPGGQTRIQAKNRAAIFEAALTVFAATGYHGATLDQIARAAGLSKPNLLYYFPTKAAIYEALLGRLLDTWLEPLRALDADGDPADEILTYMRRKLQMSRQMPRESRLFAGEVLAGAPVMGDTLGHDLRALVDEKAAIIDGWARAGRIAPVDPHHLIFSIWALTQHYADFDAQVRAVIGPERDPFAEAALHLDRLFTRLIAPG